MGGGDLNTKKSWHPNTMKNQERVWKAEQAAAEEKKRILELQHERAQERDRAELNDLARMHPGSSGAANDSRLHWMYDKPDKKVHHEDYLLGKAIEKNYDQPEKSDQDIIPAVARRVVGSSMLTTAGDAQVDLARKIREDPLLLVKERERAARAALLNNPLQRRRLTELLRKEQEQKKESKTKKKAKNKGKNLDNMLAAKLNALGSEKSIDLAALLASDNSSSDSSSEEQSSRKKKKKNSKEKKSKKTKEKQKSIEADSDSSDNDRSRKNRSKGIDRKKRSSKERTKSKQSKDTDTELENEKRHRDKSRDNEKKSHMSSHKPVKVHKSEPRKRKSVSDSENEVRSKRTKDNISGERMRHNELTKSRHYGSSDDDHRSERRKEYKSEEHMRYNESMKSRRYDASEDDNKREKRRQTPERSKRNNESDGQRKQAKRGGLSEEERAARLAAMVSAGAEREVQRGRRVAEQRAAAAAPERAGGRRGAGEAHALPDSLESRIHSNRHYIQRDRRHMNEHFARR